MLIRSCGGQYEKRAISGIGFGREKAHVGFYAPGRYPAAGWIVAIAATCWYITEITGEVYNLGLGNISQVMFCLVRVFYGTNVILWALSGYRWRKD